MPKPASRTVPHFLILDEVDTDRRLVINTNTLSSFYEEPSSTAGEPPFTHIHLIDSTTYIVRQDPVTILAQIYNAEAGDDND